MGTVDSVKEMEIYEAIYDAVAEGLTGAGIPFDYHKATFLSEVGMHPQDIDISRFLELDNSDFYQAVYAAVFRHLPDERTTRFWREREDLPTREYQRQVLESLNHSSVVAINQIHLVNNPYFVQTRGLKYRLLGQLYGLTDKSSLRELGKRLPQPIQKIIRKVFL